MLEIRKGTASRSYENTFFREFAKNLEKLFDKYALDGLLIANSECEAEKRLQIDALLITKNVVCIIDFKNFDMKLDTYYNPKNLPLKNKAAVFSSRACPLACNFCDMFLVMGKKHRKRSVTKIVDELELLAETAGAEIVGRFTQKVNRISPKYFIGKGKAEQIVNQAQMLDVEVPRAPDVRHAERDVIETRSFEGAR